MARVYTAKITKLPEYERLLETKFDTLHVKDGEKKRIYDTHRTPGRRQIMYDAQEAMIAHDMLEAFENGEKITQRQLGEKYNVSVGRIKRSLDEIRLNWRESSIRDWDALTQKKLAELELIKQEALESWYQSLQSEKSYEHVEDEHGKERTKFTEKSSAGNARFLNVITNCIKQEVVILGLEAPKEIQINTLESKLIDHLKSGRISVEVLEQELGSKEQARLYARKAGLLNSGRL